MTDIVYTFEGHAYLNITNACPCRCEFCIRNNGDSVGDAQTLWFKGHTPDIDEIKKAVDAYDFSAVSDEIIFCGYGEPTCAYGSLLESADYLRSKLPGCRLRLNTNGLSDLINKKPTAEEICRYFDIVSVSLNAPTPEKYDALCHSCFGPDALPAVIKFAKECKQYGAKVKFTVVDVISEEDIEACRRIADEAGIEFRVRVYTAE